MSDRAALSFDVDSSQAQRAVAVLQTLVQQSQSAVAAQQQLKTSSTDLATAYSQNRGQLEQLAAATQAYGGTLQGLVAQMNTLRTAMSGSQQDFQAYARLLTTAQGMAIQLNTSVEGISRFVTTAREMNVTTSDLATGLGRITEALKAQSAAGNDLRVTLAQLGVMYRDVPANRPDLVLQRIAEQLRQYGDTAGKLRAAQQIFGQQFTGQDMLQLENQPPVSYWTEQQRTRDAERKAAIDNQQQMVQRMEAEERRFQAELSDRRARLSTEPTAAGRLGLTGAGPKSGQSWEDYKRELDRIDKLSPKEREPYEGYGFQLGKFLNDNKLTRWGRHILTGQADSNVSQINAQANEDYRNDTSRFAWWRSVGSAIGQRAENMFNLYDPPQNLPENRPMPRAEWLDRLTEGGRTIQGLAGSSGPLQRAGLMRRWDALQETPLGQYIDAYGSEEEGERQRGYDTDRLRDQMRYARDPTQRFADRSQQEAYIMGLPEEQRAHARAAISGFETVNPGKRAPVYPGQGLEAATNAGATTPEGFDQSRTIDKAWQDEQNVRRQREHEFAEQTIRQNERLAEAFKTSRVAAENANTSFQAYTAEILKSGDAAKAADAATDALNVRIRQRITVGEQLITQSRQQAEESQARAVSIERGLRSDPVTRAALGIANQIELRRERLVNEGTLPNDSAVLRRWTTQNFQAQAAEGGQNAVQLRQALQERMETTQAVGGLVSQGVPVEQARQRVELERQFADEAAKAQAALENANKLEGEEADKARAAAEAEIKRVETQRQLSEEMQRQQGIQQELVNLQDKSRQLAEQTALTIAKMAAPQWMRTLIDTLHQTLGGLTGASGMPGAASNFSGVYGVVAGAETGGQNIQQRIHDVNTEKGTPAEGYFQIIGPTWQRYGKQAGIDLSQYPNAMRAPPDVQQHVASFIPGSEFGPRTQGAIRARYPNADMSRPLGDIAVAHGEQRDPTIPTPSGASSAAAPGGTAAGAGAGGAAGAAQALTGFTAADEIALYAFITHSTGNLPPGWRGKDDQTISRLNEVVREARQNRNTNADYTIQQMRERLQTATNVGRQRVQAAGEGPAAVQNVPTPNMDLPPEQRQQQMDIDRGMTLEQMREKYGVEAANRAFARRRGFQQQDVYGEGGTPGQQIFRQRMGEAGFSAEDTRRTYGGEVVNERAVQHQNLTTIYQNETKALLQQNQAWADQTRSLEAAAAASDKGPASAERAEAIHKITEQLQYMAEARKAATTAEEREAIDRETAALNKQAAAYDRLAQARAEAGLGAQNYQRHEQQELQKELNQHPFATEQQRDSIRRWSELARNFREHPGLEQSATGQNAINTEHAQDQINETTERMNELRGAAQSASQAIGSAFESVATRSQTAGEAAKGLMNSLERIAIQTFVTKPFEKAMNSLFDSIFGDVFGGDSSEGQKLKNGGGGGGGGVGGGLGSLTKAAMQQITSGGGGGGGGGDGGGGGGGGDGGAFDGAGMGSGGGDGSTGGDVNVGSSFAKSLDSFSGTTSSWNQPGGYGSGAGSGGGSGGGGLMSRVFGHYGGLTGYLVDKIGGEGFYKGGGLIGSMFKGSGPADAFNPSGFGDSAGADYTGDYSFTNGSASAFDASGFGDTASAGADLGAAGGEAGFDVSGFASSAAFARGGVVGGLANARNTVVEAPTVFRFAQGGRTGMAGEAGAEAILPLKRDGSGRLGVSAGAFGGGGGGGDTHHHTWNVNTPDPSAFMAHSTQSQVANRVSASMGRARSRNST